MPKLKKISALKKLPRESKLNRVLEKQTIFDDRSPEDLKGLVRALSLFLRAVCVEVLDYTPAAVASSRDEPLNLNKVHDELIALKTERDTWRTRCENIEAAFNALPK